jgi:TonB family protein
LQSKLESYIGQSFAQNRNLGWLIYGDIINSIESVSAPQSAGWVSLTAEGAVLTVRRAEAPSRPTIGQGSKTGTPPIPDRIRVGAAVQSSRAIEKTTPNYPALARQAKVQGSVSLSVILSKAGGVQSVDVISGHPLLIPAAIEAVKQWRYKPTLLNGNPVEVETTVDINFSLAE